MNASRATTLLHRTCFIKSPDGLVNGTITDVKVAYGTTRVEVQVPVARGTSITKEVRTFDAARVLLWNGDILTPALEY